MTIERPTAQLVEKSCLEFEAQEAGYDAAMHLVFKQWHLNTVRAGHSKRDGSGTF
jgi:hypothetical protein